jgi:dimethylaniline monooxygenase (N-oxide forming)
MERRVAIIGAGISGLLACKYCLSKGYTPIVFDSRATIGGVWTKTIRTTRLQNVKPYYQFSDFPWPETVTDELPSQKQVQEYMYSYAAHFNLLSHINLNSKAVNLTYQGPDDSEINAWTLWGGNGHPFSGKGKWIVTVHNTQSLSTEDYVVDFVILCVGRFSDVPNIPEFPLNKGPEVFDGDVMHAMDYANLDGSAAAEYVKGKRVTVVGFQKSAMDIAMECSTVNAGVENPCTLVYRTKRWHLSDFAAWGVPIGYLYFNRFSELLIHKPGEGLLLSLLATILSPLRWAFSKFVESSVKSKLQLKKFGMVPKHSFLKDLSSCLISAVPDNFYNRVEEGQIKLKEAQNFCFSKEGILINGEASESVKTDLVILATGYRMLEKLKDVFASPYFQKCIAGSADTVLPLYRDCIHPRIPQIAVIGFSTNLSDLHTSEMRSRWVGELLEGTFKLPSIAEMEKEVEQWNGYMKKYTSNRYGESALGAIGIWYNDMVCKDMGWNCKRKKGIVAELFQPYAPWDYTNPWPFTLLNPQLTRTKSMRTYDELKSVK